MIAHQSATPSRISTSGCSDRERLAVLHDCYARAVVKSELKVLGDGPLHFDAMLQPLPGLTISSIACSGLGMLRRKAWADPDRLVLTITLAGGRHATQRGREATLQDGDALLTSGDAGEAVIFPGSRYLSLAMPTRAIAPLVSDLDDHLLRPIPRGTEPLRLLVSYLRTMEACELTTPDMQRVVAGHIQDLAALTIGTTPDVEFERLQGVRAARLRAIKADIRQNVASNLSVAALAARHRLPVRYLQRLFEDAGTTFTDFVLSERLLRAHRMLTDARHADRAVSTIAFDTGFNHLSYFNRAFRARFGAAPSDIRAQARRAS
jgi:AraC-like DNA-binding protein